MEDAGIIELYWQRDERAIAETDGKYGAFCRSIAMNVLEQREDAEECVNDTYQKAWDNMPPQRPQRLRAWLGRVVRNAALDLWTRGHAQKRYGGMQLILDELEECIPDAASVERLAEEAELTDIINAWLRGLPREDRVLFVRRYWNGEALKALAEESGAAPGKLAQKMFRLRNSLKAALEKEGVSV